MSRLNRAIVGLMLVLAVAGSGAVGCASTAALAPGSVPIAREPVQDIPAHLDLVVRIDAARVRQMLPTVLNDLYVDLTVNALGLASFRQVFLSADKIWIGMRPVASERSSVSVVADYVVVFEGGWTKDDARAFKAEFHAPRDLGGACLRYDARDDTRRERPGRVYEKAGERLSVASAAEIDALERVIEHNQHQRTQVPPDQGLVSFSANLAGLGSDIERHSPKAGRFLGRAKQATGYLDLSQDGIDATARVRFMSMDDAKTAATAFELVIGALSANQSATLGIRTHTVEKDVVLQFSTTLTMVLALLGLA